MPALRFKESQNNGKRILVFGYDRNGIHLLLDWASHLAGLNHRGCASLMFAACIRYAQDEPMQGLQLFMESEGVKTRMNFISWIFKPSKKICGKCDGKGRLTVKRQYNWLCEVTCVRCYGDGYTTRWTNTMISMEGGKTMMKKIEELALRDIVVSKLFHMRRIGHYTQEEMLIEMVCALAKEKRNLLDGYMHLLNNSRIR
jgi:hypothetical protein